MSSLAWLAIPLFALVLGVLWAVWVARERPRVAPRESMSEHERFKAAFERMERSHDTRGDSRS